MGWHILLLTGATTQLVDVYGSTAPPWAQVIPSGARQRPMERQARLRQAEAAREDRPAPLIVEVCQWAQRGELQKVVTWLRKGGLVNALYHVPTEGGQTTTVSLLHSSWPWVAAECSRDTVVVWPPSVGTR